MKTVKIMRIVKVIKGPDDIYKVYFPINLVTKIIKIGNRSSIFSVNNGPWPVLSSINFTKTTPREQFLFYINEEKPFVMEE